MFAKEKQVEMNNELITVQVSGVVHTEKSIGSLVDLMFDDKCECTSASRLIWFPKSICEIQILQPLEGNLRTRSFVTAPKWFLDKNKIIYKI